MRTIVTKASEVGFTFHKIYNMTLKKPMPLHTTIYRVFALKKPFVIRLPLKNDFVIIH
jgi:hypothetical protein